MAGQHFLVYCYRWGCTNEHRYVAGCWGSKEEADRQAVMERSERGGKYGVAVYQLDGDRMSMVSYLPSTKCEQSPRFNWRVYVVKMVGSSVVYAHETGTGKANWNEKIQTILERNCKYLRLGHDEPDFSEGD
jgi:hypothetical protein